MEVNGTGPGGRLDIQVDLLPAVSDQHQQTSILLHLARLDRGIKLLV